MKKYDVIALGELLIDFTENGVVFRTIYYLKQIREAHPAMSLQCCRSWEIRPPLLGKVGADFLGQRLKNVITEVGIDTRYLYMDEKVPTTLAFVHTLPDGDRDFSFYRNPGADMMLTADEVPQGLFADTKIFHFGTLSMTHNGVRNATKKH